MIVDNRLNLIKGRKHDWKPYFYKTNLSRFQGMTKLWTIKGFAILAENFFSHFFRGKKERIAQKICKAEKVFFAVGELRIVKRIGAVVVEHF
jgi:hypothetical protein